GGGQSSWTGTDHGDLLAGSLLRRLRFDPALFKCLVDYGALDVLDRHRRFIDAENTRSFAWRRADSSGKFREIIRLEQSFQRIVPQTAVNEVIPLRNEIVNRAACRHA